MSTLRLLIADDEPVIRMGLRSGLARMEGVEVVAECSTGGTAIESILSSQPDAAFLDIQMPDCSGLDIIEQVGPKRMPIVVFVTAFDEYALKAIELNAVDYLLKPFDQNKLQRSVDRVRERLASRVQKSLAAQLQVLLDQRRDAPPDRLVVRNGGRYEFVPIESVDWIEAANNYVQLHCGARTHLLTETMSRIEKKVDSRKFVRVHRCKIVNVSRIVAVHTGLDETFDIELRGGLRLSSGKQFKKAVQSLISR